MRKIILKTKRLRLEEVKKNHFNDLYSLLSNSKVHKHFPKALNKNEAKEFYDRIQNRYKSDGYCFWAVIRIVDNEFLGICGILRQEVDGQVEAEIGYRFIDKFWCNGYATEAAKGCIGYAKEKLRKSSIISLIRPDNIASIRVAEKNGLKLEKETIFHDLPHQLYRLQLC